MSRCGQFTEFGDAFLVQNVERSFPEGSTARTFGREAENRSKIALGTGIGALALTAASLILVVASTYDRLQTPQDDVPTEVWVGLGLAGAALIPAFISQDQAHAANVRIHDAVNAYNQEVALGEIEGCSPSAR
ncbi:MAG: hypothetical protein HC923_00360 [Myxococcales bacterium]|nr:hypothetical protein [Myxococcales bacterium]